MSASFTGLSVVMRMWVPMPISQHVSFAVATWPCTTLSARQHLRIHIRLDLCVVVETSRSHVRCAPLHSESRIWIFSVLVKACCSLDRWEEMCTVERRVTLQISLHFLPALDHDNGHSFSQLSEHTALTCPESQGACALAPSLFFFFF